MNQILNKIAHSLPAQILAIILGTQVFLHDVQADPYKLTIAGASPSGLWSLIGAGVDAAVRAEYPDSTITYQTSGGGIANVAILMRNDADLALIHDAELRMAKNGEPPFRSPIENIRILSYIYTWAPMQALIRESFASEYGIQTFEDIARVKPPITVAINRRGNVVSNIATEMFTAAGITEDDIEDWGGRIIYAASNEQTELLQDRRVDMVLNSLFVKHSSIMQAANSVDLRLLPVSEETINTVTTKTGTISFVIPGGSYAWAPEDVPTVSVGVTLAVNEDMAPQTAYDLTKALFKHHDQINRVHPAMQALTPDIMSSTSEVPFHEGALRYLSEIGLR